MKRVFAALIALGLCTTHAQSIVSPNAVIPSGVNGGGGGSGTVTSVSITTANGVSGTVATPTTTPAITLTLGAITPTTVNGLTLTTSTGTLTITNGKTFAVSNSLTLAGTDSTTMTFPTTSATIARTDAANTFTGHQTIEGVTSTGATGTGKFVFDTSPTIGNPTVTGTFTVGGASAATMDFPNAGDTNVTATGAGKIIWAPVQRYNGAIYDSTGVTSAVADTRMTLSSSGLLVLRPRLVVPLPFLDLASSGTAWTAGTSAGFIGGSSGSRTQIAFDASPYTQARISVSIGSTAPVANTIVYVRYFTSTTATFANYLPAGTASADVQVLLPASGETCTVGSWVDLVSGAKADVFWTIGGVAPSGSTSLSVVNVTVEFR